MMSAMHFASYTPTLNALAMLGAAETGYVSAVPTVETPQARDTSVPPPRPVSVDPPTTAPADVTSTSGLRPSKATSFEISLGGAKTVETGGRGIAHLQKLKQRQTEKREQLRVAPNQGAAKPTLEGAPEPTPSEPNPAQPLAPLRPGAAANRQPALPASRSRNNKQLITNALKHVCLTGAVNKPQLDTCIAVVDGDDTVTHFVVLLKDEYNKQFRGLYHYRGEEVLQRVFGAGPLQVRLAPVSAGVAGAGGDDSQMPAKYFKFDTGGKKFAELPAVSFNQMTDAITLPPRMRNGKPPL
jgi:hypothetical protein